MAELLPCPFCGAAATVFPAKGRRLSNAICCGKCVVRVVASATEYEGGMREAVRRWNARAPSVRPGDEVSFVAADGSRLGGVVSDVGSGLVFVQTSHGLVRVAVADITCVSGG